MPKIPKTAAMSQTGVFGALSSMFFLPFQVSVIGNTNDIIPIFYCHIDLNINNCLNLILYQAK